MTENQATINDARSKTKKVPIQDLCWRLWISVLKQGGTQQHEQIDRHLSNGNGNPPGSDCNLCVRFG
jgi:hypothetical protein